MRRDASRGRGTGDTSGHGCCGPVDAVRSLRGMKYCLPCALIAVMVALAGNVVTAQEQEPLIARILPPSQQVIVLGEDRELLVDALLPPECAGTSVSATMYLRGGGASVNEQQPEFTAGPPATAADGTVSAVVPVPEQLEGGIDIYWPGVDGDCLDRPLVYAGPGVRFAVRAGPADAATFVIPHPSLPKPPDPSTGARAHHYGDGCGRRVLHRRRPSFRCREGRGREPSLHRRRAGPAAGMFRGRRHREVLLRGAWRSSSKRQPSSSALSSPWRTWRPRWARTPSRKPAANVTGDVSPRLRFQHLHDPLGSGPGLHRPVHRGAFARSDIPGFGLVRGRGHRPVRGADDVQ